MNPYTPARLALVVLLKALVDTLADDDEATAALDVLEARVTARFDEWQRRQTTAIDEDGNIVIGLKPLALSGRPLSMR